MNQSLSGKSIRSSRRKFDITQIELSNFLGWSNNNSYISNIESGKVSASENQLKKILEAIETIAKQK